MVGSERRARGGWGGWAGEMAEKRGVGGWCDGNRGRKMPHRGKGTEPPRYRAHKPLYLIVPKQSDMAGFRNRETVFDPGKVTGYVFRDGFMDGNRSRGTRRRETRIP